MQAQPSRKVTGFCSRQTAILLYRHLFDMGLPLRGALACGKFLVHETCCAGRNIIEAYKLTQQLDLSAVVFAESAMSEINEVGYGKLLGSSSSIVKKYLVPLKNAKSSSFLTLAPSLKSFSKGPLPLDLRQHIASAFWQHKKDLPPEEIKKIDNTELYYRFFKMKVPDLFL